MWDTLYGYNDQCGEGQWDHSGGMRVHEEHKTPIVYINLAQIGSWMM